MAEEFHLGNGIMSRGRECEMCCECLEQDIRNS